MHEGNIHWKFYSNRPASVSMQSSVQFLKFLAVGLAATFAHYACMIMLIEGAKFQPVAATCVGYGVGAIISYCINYKFTFDSDRPHLTTAGRFLLGTLLGFVMNAFLLGFGTSMLRLAYPVAQVGATGIVFFFNFILSKAWTFRKLG